MRPLAKQIVLVVWQKLSGYHVTLATAAKTCSLRFHNVHGNSIALSNRGATSTRLSLRTKPYNLGTCATRLGGYSNGLCFSHAPLAAVDGCRSFEIRIERQTQIVAGVLIIGITTVDPATLVLTMLCLVWQPQQILTRCRTKYRILP